MGWVRHSGPFTSRAKTEKRVRDIKLFDAVKGCRFQIRSLPNDPSWANSPIHQEVQEWEEKSIRAQDGRICQCEDAQKPS